MSDDDDFWIAHTALTPEEDKAFAGCGKILAWAIVVMLIVAAVAVALR